jgi:hypothetical protein
MISCKICNEKYANDKSFHAHLKKHNIYQAEYYCTYYPRKSLYYKQQIPFKNKKQYFDTEFLNYSEFLDWEKSTDKESVKTKCLELLKNRINEKNYSYAPFHNEMLTLDLPEIDIYKKHFGSYGAACRLLNKEPLFNMNLPKNFNDVNLRYKEILIDTREQDPLTFAKYKVEKLYVGDYLLNDGNYSYTFVDRKSENDFLGTLASGVERFDREIERACGLGAYLFVVIESSIDQILENHKKYKRKTNLEYVFHNMRHLSHKYPRHVQFVFTGSRNKSVDIIPKILYHGKSLWQVDLQYFIDHELGNRQSEGKKELFNQQ